MRLRAEFLEIFQQLFLEELAVVAIRYFFAEFFCKFLELRLRKRPRGTADSADMLAQNDRRHRPHGPEELVGDGV